MKRIVSMLVVITLFITGCGSTNETDMTNTKQIDIEGIAYTIPNDPQRIVADYYVGELLMLDANLVGADLTYTSNLWGDFSDVTNVGQSMESIAALNPDLIITMNADLVDQYEVIAPTVLIPYGTYNPEELVLKLSEITSTQDKAQQWINDFNAAIDNLSQLIDLDQTYSIIELTGDTAYYYGENYGRAGYIIYNKLGLKSTDVAEESYVRKPDSYLTATIESLPAYTGDNIILVVPSDVDVSSHMLIDNVVWEDLEAVKNDQVYIVDANDFWFSDPYSLDKQIEILTEIASGTYE